MFLATKRTEGISSSDLILRIIKDHEEFTWRSLQKKYKPEELGVTADYAEYVKIKAAARAKVEKAKEKLVTGSLYIM